MKKRFQLSIFASVFLLVTEIWILVSCIKAGGGSDPLHPLCYFLILMILLTVGSVIVLCKRIRMIDEAGAGAEPDFWHLRDRRTHPKRFWFAVVCVVLMIVLTAVILIRMMIDDHGFDPAEPLYYAGFGQIAVVVLSLVIGAKKRRP